MNMPADKRDFTLLSELSYFAVRQKDCSEECSRQTLGLGRIPALHDLPHGSVRLSIEAKIHDSERFLSFRIRCAITQEVGGPRSTLRQSASFSEESAQGAAVGRDPNQPKTRPRIWGAG